MSIRCASKQKRKKMSYPYGTGYPSQPGSQVHTYPPYPGSQGNQQSAVGFNVNNVEGYPPPVGGAYPPTSGGYPPIPGGAYPSQGGGYPPYSTGESYPPPSGGGYPPSTGGSYPPPPAGAGYPPPTGGSYPPPSGAGYPPPTGGSYPPPSGAGYPPPTGGSYPPPSGAGYPPPTSGYGSGYSQGQNPPVNLSSFTTHYPGQPTGAPAQSLYPQHSPAYPGDFNRSASPLTSGGSGHAKMLSLEQGTVVPAKPFDPQADAQALRKAMKGFGTDEKSIINVLTRCVNSQRQQIAVSYKTQFGKDLIKDLKNELSGRFEDVILAMMTPMVEFLASEIHHAISGVGTDEDSLIEILCTRNNHDIREIKESYKKLYRQSLENDIKGDTSGDFKRLLVSMTTGGRDESPADPAKAKVDAQSLYNAGVGCWGTDESTFNAIMASRSFAHLTLVFSEYRQLSGHTVPQAIEKEFSGKVKQGLLTIAKCVENKVVYFAERIHKSMKGMGTDDHTLIRLITTRCEIDMVQIKQEYQKLFGKSLEHAISSDTSGDYKHVLIALVGGA
ncbi:annexin B9-like isoform X2 [Limulus polyphemus]|uniref:Annexin n=1 Tax=Limulus polyphemus TaxID=6850 RepID=A0ABM1RY21_LIMPO|nr:annexin B9-like isoform X2 [Limulus polyphemus]